jgi:GMP synthase (glutamine-hydrolysing)
VKPILLARNDPWETFGVTTSAFGEVGAPVLVYDAVAGHARPSLDEVSGVVVFGSSYNVEHADEKTFIKELRELTLDSMDLGLPYLGVCFGAQVLAWSQDALVGKGPVREVGFEPIHPTPAAAEDRLLSHYADGDHVFQWHMDTFDLPQGAELLVTGDAGMHQAYRIGDRTWGVQFHFEIDEPEIMLWLTAFAAEGDLERDWGKSFERVRGETSRHIAEHQRKGREVFHRFAGLARESP